MRTVKKLDDMLSEIIVGRGNAQRTVIDMLHQLRLYKLHEDKERINNTIKIAEEAVASWFPKEEGDKQ